MNAIDTNVFVYAFDHDSPQKRERALALIEALPPSETVLLWQVACELGSVLGRLGPRSAGSAAEAIASVRARFAIVIPSPEVIDGALRLRAEQQVSWWDALLLSACADAGVTRLYSEDLQSAPKIAGVEIVNPFV